MSEPTFKTAVDVHRLIEMMFVSPTTGQRQIAIGG
jgi:hypothetical protein